MKPYLRALALLMVFVLCACFGCRPSLAQAPVPTVEYAVPAGMLTTSTVDSLTELVRLPAISSRSGRIVALHTVPETSELLVGYEGDGHLRRWDLATQAVLAEYEVGIVSSEGVDFDLAGAKFISSINTFWKPGGLREAVEYIEGIALWDAARGSFIRCLESPCELDQVVDSSRTIGANLSPSGQWLATYTDSTVSLTDIDNIGYSGSINIVSGPSNGAPFWHLSRVEFDSSSTQLALAFAEGQVWIMGLNESGLLRRQRIIGKGEPDNSYLVKALAFDTSGKWLATIRNDKLQIWKLAHWIGAPQIAVDVANGRALAFGQSGEFVVVATDASLQFWSVKTADLIAEYDAPGISSLVISHDNRLIIWGDNEGTVHLWGTREDGN